jgi:glyoxylase-like metal-dependent hydrolase (beta-lactamase superfamily II)
MQIGNYEAHLINAGYFRLDGGAMFGVVPKVLWERHHPADEKNRIHMCTNLLLLQGEGKNILVDTGNSPFLNEKAKSNYAISTTGDPLGAGLNTWGISRSEVTDIVLTHLHFDHAGGAVGRNGSGGYAPAFPNARYHVQKKQLDWAQNPSGRDRASYMNEMIQPLLESGQINLLDGPGQIFPGIEVLTFDGHTAGQQLPLIDGNPRKLFYAGDLIPLASQLSPPWIMSYDLQPVVTLSEKNKLLKKAADEDWIIIFEHDPETPCARIEQTEKGWKIGEVVKL